jgi:hypothetical protein
MVEALRSSETSALTRTTWCNITEDGILHNHRFENLKSSTVKVVPSSLILFSLKMGAIRSPKRQFLQKLHGVTSQDMAFFMVAAVKISNITKPHGP